MRSLKRGRGSAKSARRRREPAGRRRSGSATPARASRQMISRASSTRSSAPSRKGWAWDCRLLARSSRRITARFPQKTECPVVPCSRSSCRLHSEAWRQLSRKARRPVRDRWMRLLLRCSNAALLFSLISINERPRSGSKFGAMTPTEGMMFPCGRTIIALALLVAIPVGASAQTADKPADPAVQTQPANQPPPTAELLKPEQLEALVAPIALYPDELLANLLAASTYPLEVVQADRWLKEHKSLKGDALKTGVDKQAWDDSVKALASTAEVLTMMSDKLEWTKSLGDAFLAQQPDVMDAVQRLRTKAYDNKKLVTTTQQKVSVKTEESRQVVVIEPAVPDTMYVPYYEPATVYGAWPYAEYPPYYFGYPSYIGAGVVAAGLAFGTAWAIGRWGNYWGGGCNWGNRNVYINHRTTNIANGWQHNAAHRQGVRYNNANGQQRFGNNSLKAGAADRMDFRGRDGQQVLDRPGGDRAGDRSGDRAGDRAGNRAGDRSGDRAGAADRTKGGGDRAKASGERAKSGGAKSGNKGGGDRAKAANRAGGGAANRGGGGNRGGAMNVSSGRSAAAASARG